MFEFLLKYSPVVFKEGSFSFNFLPSIIVLIFLFAAGAAILWLSYRKTTLEISRVFKGGLIASKFIAIALILFMLLEPIITVSEVTPRKSSLLVLVDDSQSMSIKDAGENFSRTDYTRKLLGDNINSGLIDELKKNFKVQLYKFSSEVDPLTGCEQLSAGGGATNLSHGLNLAADMSRQIPISGVVLLTDGVDNGQDDPLEMAAILKNKNLPIFVIGIGSEKSKDVELSKVAANHSVIENSLVDISVLIKQQEFSGKQVELELREDGAIVKKQTVKLSGATTRTSLRFSPQKKGFVRYTLNVITSENESIKQNNSKSFLIDNRSKKARILYIEGHPRAEFKYLRRAIDQDESLELISLLRTGPDKFYRQGVKNEIELKDGYPKTKKELFEYDAIIFGSVEAEFFSDAELENTLEFVSQRGGGFLMIGGGYSFAQGGYSGTSIAKLLPVELPQQNGFGLQPPTTFNDKFRLLLTPDGLQNRMLQLTSDKNENRAKWEKLPELEGYNLLGKAKPGATVLAVHPLSEKRHPKVILAQQKFGRGKSMVWASASSWLWQMGMPHQDMSHERFWRQILRWLAMNSPEPVEGHCDKDTYIPNEQVTVTVDVRDSSFVPIKDANIKARITTPSGEIVELPFQWSSNGKVAYIAAYHPQEKGLYKVEMMAYSAKGTFLGKTETAFFVEESRQEFTNAQLQTPLLKRIAEISGGKYYHQDEAKNLPDEIAVRQSSYSKLVEHDLWDMPILFLLVILILSIEWYVRRSRGLS